MGDDEVLVVAGVATMGCFLAVAGEVETDRLSTDTAAEPGISSTECGTSVVGPLSRTGAVKRPVHLIEVIEVKGGDSKVADGLGILPTSKLEVGSNVMSWSMNWPRK